MEASEFQQYFNVFPYLTKHFVGIFSLNKIPLKLKYRHFCIVNTALSNSRVGHWFVILNNDKNNIEIFDSLGIDSKKEDDLKNFCKIRTKNLIVNETSFQANESISCGKFCIYFAINR